MKKNNPFGELYLCSLKKTLKIMRNALILLFVGVLQANAIDTYSQKTRLSLNFTDTELTKVLDKIEVESQFFFLYNEKLLDTERKVNVNENDQLITVILDDLFKDTNVRYSIVDRKIILAPDYLTSESEQQQQKKITGTVIDKNKAPLYGVNIVVTGTILGTMTNASGKYSIEVPPGSKSLSFSFIGMESQEINIGILTQIDVIMAETSNELEEVVVVGYGTQKTRNITGAISQIKEGELADIPVSSISQKLQGKMAGVQIYQTSGEPDNRGLSIRIRGQASITAGNMPLVVIDGFPAVSGMKDLSPDEIESISILKDASAASLYGSRGANGVILITTKSAKSGVQEIEFNSYVGYQKVSKRGRPDVMNAQEFAQFKKEFYEDAAIYEGYTGGVPVQYQHPEQVKGGTDWYNLLLQNGMTENYNLGISTGVAKLKSASNFNYNKQEGVTIDTYAERMTARSNNLYVASDKLTFGLNLSGIYRKSNIIPNLGGYQRTLALAFLMDPALNYKNDDGTYPVSYQAPGMFKTPNYYLVLKDRKYIVRNASGMINSFAEMEIIKGFKYKFSANVELGNLIATDWVPSTANQGNVPTGSYGTQNYMTWLIENLLTYSKTFNEKHNFDALIGYSAQKGSNETTGITARTFPDDEVSWFNAATSKTGTGSLSTWSMLSYIGRLNYNYNKKYLISLAFRRDGSSRFGSNARWANFPSVSLGWIVTDESFMKNINKLSYLKLRTSYGLVGNNNIGDYTQYSSVAVYPYVINGATTPGKALSTLGNSNLTWETTKQFDIGLDLGLFKDRIYFTYDYYHKRTDGLLYAIDIPQQSGYSSVQANIGEFKFWGHEFGLETKNFVGDFSWNTNFTLSIDRNEAIKLGTNNVPIGGYDWCGDINRTQVGHPIGQFMGFIFDGVYMTQEEYDTQPKNETSMVGTARMKDISGPNGKPDGVIDGYDRTIIGDPNPDFLFGITNVFSYKNFDASIVMAGSVGGDICYDIYEWDENLDGVFNVTKEVAQRWRSLENPGNGDMPRTRAGTTAMIQYNNTRWIKDGSFLAVKNLTLGYNLPIKANPYIKSARFYISGQNVLMFTKYVGMNPEVSYYTSAIGGLNGLTQGIDANPYPISIIYTIGVNVKF